MEPSLSDRQVYPTFFRTVPDDRIRYTAVIKFLLHLGWNFVGMITPSDGSGDAELSELSKVLTQHGICIEYVIKFPIKKKDFQHSAMIIDKSVSSVAILCGEIHAENAIYLQDLKFLQKNITLLLHESWTNLKTDKNLQYHHSINCSFSFTLPTKPVPGVEAYIDGLNSAHNPNDPIAEDVSLFHYSEICYKCPDEDWPNKERVKCIPRTYEFLSYENDVLVLVFVSLSLLFCITTLFIFASFIYFRDTPIVKANNRTVSFILLAAISLSFLCVFLFLGRPVDITCMLRQISFGIFFSTTVSCILAKTVTVCIAFKATKPDSVWRKWVGGKVSNFIVLFSSSVQVLICVIWLSVSPPYKEYDIHSSPGKIIIQCNEGSVIGFYSMLGYMGFLAAVSFVLAFMVRTLPDSFNEAKYITFSMLVFCSVWIAMIPAYLSTGGKYMVAVEIFTILTSSAGILSCIFFPKMYILLVKPDLNTKKCFLHTHFS
ncbi:vomeronasal type-2 receptor 26-like [Mantella aurantiaca]